MMRIAVYQARSGIDPVANAAALVAAVEEAAAGVQVDLAVVLAPAVHVEQDDEAIVDVAAPDAPGVHDRQRVDAGGLGGDVEVLARPRDDRK